MLYGDGVLYSPGIAFAPDAVVGGFSWLSTVGEGLNTSSLSGGFLDLCRSEFITPRLAAFPQAAARRLNLRSNPPSSGGSENRKSSDGFR